LALTEASVIMVDINRPVGNSEACRGRMHKMNALVRHRSEEPRQRYLPKIAAGELRLPSVGVTEALRGTSTTKTKTTAVTKGGSPHRQQTDGLDQPVPVQGCRARAWPSPVVLTTTRFDSGVVDRWPRLIRCAARGGRIWADMRTWPFGGRSPHSNRSGRRKTARERAD
jgi:hypothetical protein